MDFLPLPMKLEDLLACAVHPKLWQFIHEVHGPVLVSLIQNESHLFWNIAT
ncbi:hypothetical protein V473_20175 [Sphingobium cupriresistens LL01]|uniref:Uncharacterized protein n=1 Tax=Sphingobium cupriresistens LL01 TaxID=1420583 RepID=A0A0J7XNY6_9SPHN|nr:hypothetical protein V473_20175 [Sphingobium cupriresistens LL01]